MCNEKFAKPTSNLFQIGTEWKWVRHLRKAFVTEALFLIKSHLEPLLGN